MKLDAEICKRCDVRFFHPKEELHMSEARVRTHTNTRECARNTSRAILRKKAASLISERETKDMKRKIVDLEKQKVIVLFLFLSLFFF